MNEQETHGIIVDLLHHQQEAADKELIKYIEAWCKQEASECNVKWVTAEELREMYPKSLRTHKPETVPFWHTYGPRWHDLAT